MIEPGIYFGLDQSLYHADEALGSTDVKRLTHDPCEYYWHSHMNPVRPEDTDTPARQYGRALHAYILEGPEVFQERYRVRPELEDYENPLVTTDDLRAFLKDRELPVSGKKCDLIERALEADPEIVVWDKVQEDFHAALQNAEPISQKWFREIQVSGAMVMKNPHLQQAFSNGAPEVSVFWDQGGVPCKARFDYLKIKAVVDLKSIRIARAMSLDKAVFQAIGNYRYDIQAVHYMRARAHAADFIREGKVFGAPLPREEWLTKLAETDDFTWVWVFYKADGAPIAKGYQFNQSCGAFDVAAIELDYGLSRYREFLEKFGSEMWVNDDPIHRISQEDLPSWIGT